MTNKRAGIISMTALGIAILALLAIYAAGQTGCVSAASGTCPAGLVRTISQGLTVNDDQADSDSRIETVAATDTFYVDASTDRVGIGTSAPSTLLHVDGAITGTSYQGIVGNVTPAAGTFTTLNATGGGALTGTWSNLGTVTTVDINGGTVDGAVIGGASAAAGTFTTLNASSGGALTGTWSNLGTVTTVDINGGTVDGAVIGGASAAAGTFTTLAAGTNPATAGILRLPQNFTAIQFRNAANTANVPFVGLDGSNNIEMRAGTGSFIHVYNGGYTFEIFAVADTGISLGGSLASRSVTEPTNALTLYNGTAPVGTLANGTSLYTTAGELRVMDAAGNATLLSPHNQSTNDWIWQSCNAYAGRCKEINMESLVAAVERLTGNQLMANYSMDTPALSWNDSQQKTKLRREQEIAAYDALSGSDKTRRNRPEPYTPLSEPAWLNSEKTRPTTAVRDANTPDLLRIIADLEARLRNLEKGR